MQIFGSFLPTHQNRRNECHYTKTNSAGVLRAHLTFPVIAKIVFFWVIIGNFMWAELLTLSKELRNIKEYFRFASVKKIIGVSWAYKKI